MDLIDTIERKSFIAPGDNPVSFEDTYTTGRAFKRQDALALVGGKYVLLDLTRADGGEVPVSICPADIDATAADQTARVFVKGTFYKSDINTAAGLYSTLSAADQKTIRDGFRAQNIYLVDDTE